MHRIIEINVLVDVFGKIDLEEVIMFFDPLSTWLVTLIADGILYAGEKGGGVAIKGYDQKRVKEFNEILNSNIRRVKSKYGVRLPEMAYEQIQRHIRNTKESFGFKVANGYVVIDLDNQEYIIELLEACYERYSEDEYEEAAEKADWYKNAAIEARKRKEQYAERLKYACIRETEQKEKEENLNNMILFGGGIVFLVLLMIIFA